MAIFMEEVMALLRSGIVLFVSVTLVASVILGAFLALTGNLGGWRLDASTDWTFLFYLSIVTLPASTVLVVLAWRGRRHPLTDGVTLMTCIALAAGATGTLIPRQGTSMGNFDMVIVWIYPGIGLACLVPAYLITYFALRRTPLLRGLAPPRKTKGPAEASP